MATETSVETASAPADIHAAQEHAHPSDKEYYIVALVLALITAAEVATYYIDFFNENFTWLLVALLPMMIVKFGMVAAFFMHLRFDNKILRRVFITGILLATSVYLIALSMFHWFGFSH